MSSGDNGENNRIRSYGGEIVDIQTDDYRIAPLEDKDEALQLIEQTEETIAQLTGREVTLIAYEKQEEHQANPT